MNSPRKDYNRLYLLQDKFLSWWLTLGLPFYLTGGTALGRFYLNHRFSEDLDFFVNADTHYQRYIAEIKSKITTHFTVNIQHSLFADDFTRFFLTDDDIYLKIELINDVDYYAGKQIGYKYGLIDNPLNILSNKLTAIIGRDEPKDMFDIINLSLKYSFTWPEVFYHAKQKAVINELDVEQRIISFPVEWFEAVNWLQTAFDLGTTQNLLNQIANDFFLGKANSLGKHQPPIESATPLV